MEVRRKMKKKIFAIMMATLMSATVLGSIQAVSTDGVDDEGQETGEWETIYQMDLGDTKATEGSKTLPDLQVYRIQKRMVWLHYYHVRYWLYNTVEFTGTFDDKSWVDSYVIGTNHHNNELIGVGTTNGPYYTDVFLSSGVGIHALTVYTDFKQGDDNGNIQESDESNNEKTVWTWFSS